MQRADAGVDTSRPAFGVLMCLLGQSGCAENTPTATKSIAAKAVKTRTIGNFASFMVFVASSWACRAV